MREWAEKGERDCKSMWRAKTVKGGGGGGEDI